MKLKKNLLNLACLFPAIISLLFYLILASAGGFGSIRPCVWGLIALLFVSAGLLMRKKWWGCIGGICTSAVLIVMGTQHTGQIFSETPVGIAFCLYYALLGLLCFRSPRLSR